MEKNKKSKWSWIVSGIVIVVLIMAFSGVFDDKASELTDGAYGKGDDVITAIDKNASEEPIELSAYIGMTEDMLIETLGVGKNELGYYPNENNIIFICMDGVVYGISLNKQHENQDKDYCLFGVSIGADISATSDMLMEKLDFVSSDVIDGGKRDTYVNSETGYIVGVDYNLTEVTAVSYMAEKNDSYKETENPDEIDKSTVGLTEGTYHCETGDMIMYASWHNVGDYFSVYFAVEVLGEMTDVDIATSFVPDNTQSDTYISEEKRFSLRILDDGSFEVTDSDTTVEYNLSGIYVAEGYYVESYSS